MARAERRVDVDELLALARVLGVAPDVLLAPPGSATAAPEHQALREVRNLADRIAGLVKAAEDPGAAVALGGSVDRALRRVQIRGQTK